MKFLLSLIAIQLYAADLNPRVFNLIGPDTQMVRGVDVEKHQQSALSQLFPMQESARKVVVVGLFNKTTGYAREFTILGGDDSEPAADSDFGPVTRVLDSETKVRGDSESVNEAAALWVRDDVRPASIAYRAQQLAGSYDHWFVITRPLEFLGNSAPSPWTLKYRNDVVNAIEELSGGIRFGTNIEFKLEAVMRTSDDAKTLAALGRWLPGLAQLAPSSSSLAPLVDIAEKISMTAEGRVVTLSFQLPEEKVKELVARMQSIATGPVQ